MAAAHCSPDGNVRLVRRERTGVAAAVCGHHATTPVGNDERSVHKKRLVVSVRFRTLLRASRITGLRYATQESEFFGRCSVEQT